MICMIELCSSLMISNCFVGQGQEILIQSSNYCRLTTSESILVEKANLYHTSHTEQPMTCMAENYL
jgi:hypothetical protein